MNRVYSNLLHSASGMPIFLLDNFRSAFNVGSVFRTAEAISPAGIFLSGTCCKPGNRKLGHTSRGTHAVVPWRYFEDMHEAVDWVRESGRMIVAVENTEDAVPIYSAEFDLSAGFVFGNEALGIDADIVCNADVCVYFPQSGDRDCVNVSSTAAMIASEIQWSRLDA